MRKRNRVKKKRYKIVASKPKKKKKKGPHNSQQANNLTSPNTEQRYQKINKAFAETPLGKISRPSVRFELEKRKKNIFFP